MSQNPITPWLWLHACALLAYWGGVLSGTLAPIGAWYSPDAFIHAVLFFSTGPFLFESYVLWQKRTR